MMDGNHRNRTQCHSGHDLRTAGARDHFHSRTARQRSSMASGDVFTYALSAHPQTSAPVQHQNVDFNGPRTVHCLRRQIQEGKTSVTGTSIGTTEAVVTEHLRCFGTCDLEGIVGGYAEDAAMHSPSGTVRGHGQLRQLFARVFSEFGKPGTSFEMLHQLYDGEIGFVVWSAETVDNVYDLGTDTFVVRNGKIVAHTFAAKMTPKH
jgi:hypothetical protein